MEAYKKVFLKIKKEEEELQTTAGAQLRDRLKMDRPTSCASDTAQKLGRQCLVQKKVEFKVDGS